MIALNQPRSQSEKTRFIFHIVTTRSFLQRNSSTLQYTIHRMRYEERRHSHDRLDCNLIIDNRSGFQLKKHELNIVNRDIDNHGLLQSNKPRTDHRQSRYT